jgi:hypothetical protein
VSDADLLRRVFDARAAYNELGNTVVEEPTARFVRNADTPQVHDANLVSRVRAEADDEIDGVLARADEIYAELHHRKVMIDPDTPPAFEARLVLEGYEPHAHVELVLEGEVRALPSPGDLRLVESDADWRSLTALWQLDHEEEVAKGQHDPWGPGVTEQMVAAKRVKAPDLRFWLARVDDTDAAFFSSWPGPEGVGIVEDLFTRPEFRRGALPPRSSPTRSPTLASAARDRSPSRPVSTTARSICTPRSVSARRASAGATSSAERPDLDVPDRGGEGPEVVGIGGEDQVAALRRAYNHSGVDDVGPSVHETGATPARRFGVMRVRLVCAATARNGSSDATSIGTLR